MALELSDIMKSSLQQSLGAFIEILKKAETYAADKNIDESVLLETRIYPDMFPMKWQLQMITEFLMRGMARLSGASGDGLPSMPFEEQSFGELIARLEKTLQDMQSFDDDVLNTATDKVIELPFGPGRTLTVTGREYVLKLFLPNLYFHVTTAYNLLRQSGVEIGKLDYLGSLDI